MPNRMGAANAAKRLSRRRFDVIGAVRGGAIVTTAKVDFSSVRWGSVEWTNLVTLYLRACESRSPHPILGDHAAGTESGPGPITPQTARRLVCLFPSTASRRRRSTPWLRPRRPRLSARRIAVRAVVRHRSALCHRAAPSVIRRYRAVPDDRVVGDRPAVAR